ncbi:MAG: 50S ribosomal protein L5 [Candidatus Latescibacter sp.]|nr:50S ribosomal protein L5 [Candidatus Latescibacter sp.]
MAPRLKEKFIQEIAPALMKEFNYKSPMQIPKLSKIVVNMGVGEAVQDVKNLDGAIQDLTMIAGQKPVIRRAKKSISNFKLRSGMPIGCMVTLRHERMYEFLDRLLSFAIPRIRDFRGVPGRSFDGRGNYTLGVKEQIIFPEVDFDKIDKTRGMDITFVTTAKRDEEAKALLKAFGIPFKD